MFDDNFFNVEREFGQVCKQWLEESASELEAQVKRNSRVKSGDTKRSYSQVIADNEAIVGSTMENAIWEEFGTGIYAIGGNGRKTPWIYEDEKGNKVFTRGKTANRPMHNARIALEPKIHKHLEELFKGLN